MRPCQSAPHAGPASTHPASLAGAVLALAGSAWLVAVDLAARPGLLLLGGAVPVKVGNDVTGAAGVGGAPGGHLDEQCAVTALDKLKHLLK